MIDGFMRDVRLVSVHIDDIKESAGGKIRCMPAAIHLRLNSQAG